MTNDQTDHPASPLSLAARLEALLFVAPGPVGVNQLAAALGVTPRRVEIELSALHSRYLESGLRLQWFKSKVQLTSAPEAAADIEEFLGLEATTRLSSAALETLAIVAYQQPVTRPQIDSIRGVNSDSVLKTLLNKGMIEEVGRTEAPGRPILYGVTPDFLGHFGLNTLADLPPLDLEEEAKILVP